MYLAYTQVEENKLEKKLGIRLKLLFDMDSIIAYESTNSIEL